MVDSAPLGAPVAEGGSSSGEAASCLGVKPLLILLLLYIFVGSDVFVENILSSFEGTRRPLSGEVTNRGVIVSGILLVLAYAAILWMIDGGIL